MAGEVGNNVNYYQAWAFVFQIEGIDAAGFQDAGPLKQSLAIIEQHEGGARTAVDKSGGKFKSEKITLTRGASDDNQIWLWWQALKQGKKDKRNCTLIQQDPEGNQIQIFPLNQCIIADYEAGTWDAKKETENAMEKIELEYIDFDRQDGASI